MISYLKKRSHKVNTYTVRDPKVSHFFQKKTLEKCDTLGTFTQNALFLDYNKTKKKKVGHFGVMDCILRLKRISFNFSKNFNFDLFRRSPLIGPSRSTEYACRPESTLLAEPRHVETLSKNYLFASYFSFPVVSFLVF